MTPPLEHLHKKLADHFQTTLSAARWPALGLGACKMRGFGAWRLEAKRSDTHDDLLPALSRLKDAIRSDGPMRWTGTKPNEARRGRRRLAGSRRQPIRLPERFG